MKIYISSDHGGFELKRFLIDELSKLGYAIGDLGPYKLDPQDDYPTFAIKLATEVKKEKDSLGILICRSGIGVSIAANKVYGAHAALCLTPKHAQLARAHNNANILCLDSDHKDTKMNLEIAKIFLSHGFEGWETRHGRRVKEIMKYENKRGGLLSLLQKAIKGK